MKKISDAEASVKKSQESYRKMLRHARDPETSGTLLPFRFHPSWKYWRDVLAILPANELKVFLHLRMITDWKTGKVLFSVRHQAPVLKMDRETFDRALKALIKKQYLTQTARQGRCWLYKILKI